MAELLAIDKEGWLKEVESVRSEHYPKFGDKLPEGTGGRAGQAGRTAQEQLNRNRQYCIKKAVSLSGAAFFLYTLYPDAGNIFIDRKCLKYTSVIRSNCWNRRLENFVSLVMAG